jgi:hypothetical protein
LTELDRPRPARRSWWLEEALALPEFAGPDTPPLDGDTTADVVILGGGYTGMWTAWFLKERQPDLDVVLLEDRLAFFAGNHRATLFPFHLGEGMRTGACEITLHRDPLTLAC